MGTEEGLPERLTPEDENDFPNLVSTGYRVTSHKDGAYNCIAHAADDKSRKWDPTTTPCPGYYWPEGADRGKGPDSLRSAFEKIGYELCSGGHIEVDYDKIALYVDDAGEWQHAAKQVPISGEWSSKLGDIEDISHATPHCFRGSFYGNVVYYMRRKRN
jgi:hypothetical protein